MHFTFENGIKVVAFPMQDYISQPGLSRHSSFTSFNFLHFEKMTMSILKGLLQDYLRSLFDEGIVNDEFNEVLSLENIHGADYVVNLIKSYIEDVEMILSEISHHVEYSKIDFGHMASLAREIEDRSESMGAEHVKLACSDLITACDEKHKRKLIRSLPWVKSEFTQTKNKLVDFVRMETRIIRLQGSQPSSD